MVRSASCSSFLFEHDPIGKPDSTFPDHAPAFTYQPLRDVECWNPARTRCGDLSCTPDSKPPSRYRRREQQPKLVRSTMGSSWPNSRSGPPEPAIAPVNRGADEPAVNA